MIKISELIVAVNEIINKSNSPINVSKNAIPDRIPTATEPKKLNTKCSRTDAHSE